MLACVKHPYPFVACSQSLYLSFSPSRKGKPQCKSAKQQNLYNTYGVGTALCPCVQLCSS